MNFQNVQKFVQVFFLAHQRRTEIKKMDILYSFCAFMMCSGVCINDNGSLVSWKGTCCNMNLKFCFYNSRKSYKIYFMFWANQYDMQEIK